jgi:uncharacterized DUF497 family protein
MQANIVVDVAPVERSHCSHTQDRHLGVEPLPATTWAAPPRSLVTSSGETGSAHERAQGLFGNSLDDRQFGIHCIYRVAKRYEWDEKKNRSNRAKHGITFEVAAKVFLDPNALERQDREVDDEQRWQTIGYAGSILTVAHTISAKGIDELIRIISARKATLSERRIYEESEDLN